MQGGGGSRRMCPWHVHHAEHGCLAKSRAAREGGPPCTEPTVRSHHWGEKEGTPVAAATAAAARRVAMRSMVKAVGVGLTGQRQQHVARPGMRV